MKSIIKVIKVIVVLAPLLLVTACASAPDSACVPPPQELAVPFNPDKNLVAEGETFIFFRLYEPKYNNPLCIENILKGMINLVEVNGIVASHSAIGFSLDDEFVGITSSRDAVTGRNLCIEKCTDIASNSYMSKCNPEESLQRTYSLKVTQEEFDSAKELVWLLLNDDNTDYSISLNFRILGWELNRRFFTPREKRSICSMENKQGSLVNKANERDFNCSSLIAYVLINSVEDVRSFFEERGLDYNKIMPSDIAVIPGVELLFSSTWSEYNLNAEKYIRDNW